METLWENLTKEAFAVCYVQVGVELCTGRVWPFSTFYVGPGQPDPRPNLNPRPTHRGGLEIGRDSMVPFS